jgi:hypothetical protein
LLCKLIGHRLPPSSDLFLPERYSRCERCRERVLVPAGR